ncbi:endonuclease/exonuclease/phosphatase family protein [Gordonia rubripertincta]|uniref:Endonuclease/exonuclease/phosphatase family protein n=1 Tax=Gordonia rubripertincta TaxID=36822 RepID=A0ABT4MPU6_GORRU|nr:endonuclease/exonuclease/phosphatase family protein [Gordonia rubripertincta]MCZ4549027.1 endonuclease/exonuclease/phosphatase family protein [Gordonia rubripertincta]
MKQRLAQRGAAFKVFYFIAVVLGWALLAAVIVAIWLHYYPGKGRASTAFASAVPWLLLAAIPAVIILAVTRRWISTVLAVILLGVGIWTQAPLLKAADAPAGERITVVTSNITLGEGNVDDVVAEVRSSGADLLTVQEITPAALARFEQTELRSMLPYEFVVPDVGGVGTGIFSRFPLRDTAQLNGFGLNNLRAEVDLPGAPSTTVYAVHPIPPYPYDPDRWVGEMKRLRQTVHATTTDRVIVSGDFNSTWDHAQYRALLENGFRDATEQSGGMWKMTYPADRTFPPVIAIDHVISRGFVAADLNTFGIGSSDHRGLVVSLVPTRS